METIKHPYHIVTPSTSSSDIIKIYHASLYQYYGKCARIFLVVILVWCGRVCIGNLLVVCASVT